MQFSTIATLLALAASALAQTANFDPISKPATGEIVNAGSTYTIVWQSTVTGKITISLIGGETPATLQAVGTIAAGVDSSAGQYAWAVDSSLGKDKTYGIKITLDSNPSTFQFGFPFVIKPVGTASSSTTGYSSSSAFSSGYPTSSAASSAAPTSAASSQYSYPASSYSTSSFSAQATSSYSYSTISPAGNLSSTTRAPSTITTVATATLSTTASRTTTTSIQTAAATHVVAGSLALMGGIAAAIFAL